MRYLRIYSDEEGQSHISEHDWEMHEEDFSPPSPGGYFVTDLMPASGVTIMRNPAGIKDVWHPIPARSLVTVLKGKIRLQTSDGDSRIVEPGDQVLFEDTTGEGHQLDEVDRQEYNFAIVRLA